MNQRTILVKCQGEPTEEIHRGRTLLWEKSDSQGGT